MRRPTTTIMKRPIQSLARLGTCKDHTVHTFYCYCMALGYRQIYAPPFRRVPDARCLLHVLVLLDLLYIVPSPGPGGGTAGGRTRRGRSANKSETNRANKGLHPRKKCLDLRAHSNAERHALQNRMESLEVGIPGRRARRACDANAMLGWGRKKWCGGRCNGNGSKE